MTDFTYIGQDETALSTTQLAGLTLRAAYQNHSAVLESIDRLSNSRAWHKGFQTPYSLGSAAEFDSRASMRNIVDAGLAELQSHVRLEKNRKVTLLSRLETAWRDPDRVVFFSIRGLGERTKPKPAQAAAKLQVDRYLAEPGLEVAMEHLALRKTGAPANTILVAMGALAEFAPTREWLSWDGKVAAIARHGDAARWLDLFRYVRKTGGEILVPVTIARTRGLPEEPSDEQIAAAAGLDLVTETEDVTAFLARLNAKRTERLVLGSYLYSPGVKHIRVSVAADAVTQVFCENMPKERIGLAWTATPTDSICAPASVGHSQLDRSKARPVGTKVRDGFLALFGWLRRPAPEFFEAEDGQLVLLDTSIHLQGPSYLFSKRIQRWRAYWAWLRGIPVSYQIAPPATTRSVLGASDILASTYAGAPEFGIEPHPIEFARLECALLLLRDLTDKDAAANNFGAPLTSLVTDTAIHGGLWRLPYRQSTVWVPATIWGKLSKTKTA
jgi:hypothetical protein